MGKEPNIQDALETIGRLGSGLMMANSIMIASLARRAGIVDEVRDDLLKAAKAISAKPPIAHDKALAHQALLDAAKLLESFSPEHAAKPKAAPTKRR